MQHFRQHPARRLAGAFLAEKQETILGYGNGHRCTFGLPVRNQFRQRHGIHHGPRKDMRPCFRSLFKHAHRKILSLPLRQLLEPDSGRQTGRPCTDNHDIVFHRLARTEIIRTGPFLLHHLFSHSHKFSLCKPTVMEITAKS